MVISRGSPPSPRWSLQQIDEDELFVWLVPVEEILEQQGPPEMGDSLEQQHLQLSKVDVEGHVACLFWLD
jgi:hypothetical protein